jgi:hypothetical protein
MSYPQLEHQGNYNLPQAQIMQKNKKNIGKSLTGIIFLFTIFVVYLMYQATKPALKPQEVLDKCFQDCTVQEYLATKKHLEGQIKEQETKVIEADQVLLSGVSGSGAIASGVLEDKTEIQK